MTRNMPETLAKELTASFTDDDIQYWIYEFWMTEAKRQKVEEAAVSLGITPEQYLTTILERALDDEEQMARARDTAKDDKDLGVRLVRYYPVLKGETEAAALERAKAKETKGRRREWAST